MGWYEIRLEHARTREFPEGSSTRGYVLAAPLTEDGHLDVETWKSDKKRAEVRRFWAGEEDEVGTLIHTRHRSWAFSYAPGEDDDEPLYKLEHHQFRPDEYVSITEHDGETLPFKVIYVRPI